jgi:hypothetical protein
MPEDSPEIVHEGARWILGHDATGYGIWAKSGPGATVGEPAAQFEGTPEGLTSASQLFTHWDDWTHLALPVLATMKRSEVADKSGLHRRTIERLVLHGVRPRRGHEVDLTTIAIDHARIKLAESGVSDNGADRAVLHVYIQQQPMHDARS